MFIRKHLISWIAFLFLLWGVSSCSQDDYVKKVNSLSGLDSTTIGSLQMDVRSLVGRIAGEKSESRRQEMSDMLIERISAIEFSSPSPRNTPDCSMENYSQFVLSAAQDLLGVVSPERTFDMLLDALKRFDVALEQVDGWARRCFRSYEDWGLPPETDEILACLRKGDANGTAASPQARKALCAMSAELKARFPKIVEDLMSSKKGGYRALNYKSSIVDQKRRLVHAIDRKFIRLWAKTIRPAEFENIKSRFEKHM